MGEICFFPWSDSLPKQPCKCLSGLGELHAIFSATEPTGRIFKPKDLCHYRAPHRRKLIFQQSKYLKTYLSYFSFFHVGDWKRNVTIVLQLLHCWGLKNRSGETGIHPEISLLQGFALIFVQGLLSLGCWLTFVHPIFGKECVLTAILGWSDGHKPMPRKGQGVPEHRQALPSRFVVAGGEGAVSIDQS